MSAWSRFRSGTTLTKATTLTTRYCCGTGFGQGGQGGQGRIRSLRGLGANTRPARPLNISISVSSLLICLNHPDHPDHPDQINCRKGFCWSGLTSATLTTLTNLAARARVGGR